MLVSQIAVFLQTFVDDLFQLSGKPGFNRKGVSGARFRIPSEITADVSPRKGKVPVAISYSTAPNENKSVRASNSLARTCSGDM
jgi:hypothetical protein